MTQIVNTTTLTDSQSDIVRATLPAINANIDVIAQTFYRTMFGNHPELLENLFNRGNQAQGTQPVALAASVVRYAEHLVDPAERHVREMMTRIGYKHVSLGVTREQYRIVHDNLFSAIVEILGEAITPDVADAWEVVYWSMAEWLIDEEQGMYDEAGVSAGDVFRQAKVVERVEDPAGAVTFTVTSADGQPELGDFKPGQYISVGVKLPDGARQLRQYTLHNRPDGQHWSFTVKRVAAEGEAPAGDVSSALCDSVQVGDEIQVTIPAGDYVLDESGSGAVGLISAGVGSTPNLGILAQLAADQPQREVRVIHGDKSADKHILRSQMHSLVSALPQAKATYFYEEGSLSEGEKQGIVNLEECDLPDDATWYLCGPQPFLMAVVAQLRARGVTDEHMRYELFTPDVLPGLEADPGLSD